MIEVSHIKRCSEVRSYWLTQFGSPRQSKNELKEISKDKSLTPPTAEEEPEKRPPSVEHIHIVQNIETNHYMLQKLSLKWEGVKIKSTKNRQKYNRVGFDWL